MNAKLAVTLRPMRPTLTAFERVRVCKRCSACTSLPLERCRSCGGRNRFAPFERYVRARSRIRPWLEALAVAALAALAAALADTAWQMTAAVAGGGAALALLYWLHRRYKPYAAAAQLRRHLLDLLPAIRSGLQADLNEADSELAASRPLEAYEKLREIGWLLHSDSVKLRKIDCLNRFYLRQDMPLELETLVPAAFSEPFVRYMRNALLVNKRLIREPVLDYVLAYRYHIASLSEGRATLALVASAAVRMKAYVRKYPYFLVDYLDDLPTERFQRLCQFVEAELKDEVPQLYEACRRLRQKRYSESMAEDS